MTMKGNRNIMIQHTKKDRKYCSPLTTQELALVGIAMKQWFDEFLKTSEPMILFMNFVMSPK